MDWLFLALAALLLGWSLVSALGGERSARRTAMLRRLRVERLRGHSALTVGQSDGPATPTTI